MDFLQPIDVGTLHWFQAKHRPWLDPAMKGLTHLGDSWVMIAFLLLAVAGFMIAGWRRTALVVLATSLLALAIGQATKSVVKRVRPDVGSELFPRPPTPSFPSGHALKSMAIFGAVTLTAARRARNRWLGVLLVVAGVALSLAIGVTRLYGGVHWLSDVCAGWTAGLACALLALWLDCTWAEPGRLVSDRALASAPTIADVPARAGHP